jgi:hypothetical protein
MTKHPHLMELCKEKDITLEVCPISNEVLVRSLNHLRLTLLLKRPLSGLQQLCPCTLCSFTWLTGYPSQLIVMILQYGAV